MRIVFHLGLVSHDIVFPGFLVLVIDRTAFFHGNDRGVVIRSVDQRFLPVLVAAYIRKEREHVIRAVLVDGRVADRPDNHHGVGGVADQHDHETGQDRVDDRVIVFQRVIYTVSKSADQKDSVDSYTRVER